MVEKQEANGLHSSRDNRVAGIVYATTCCLIILHHVYLHYMAKAGKKLHI